MSTPRHYGLRSLRFKLVLASVAVEAVMLLVLVWNSTRITGDAMEKVFQNHLDTLIPMLVVSLSDPLAQRDYATLEERLGRIVHQKSLVYVELRDEQDKIVASRGEIPLAMHRDSSFNAGDHVYDQSVDITLGGQVIGRARYGLNVSLTGRTVTGLRQQGALVALTEIFLTMVLLATLGALLTRHLRTLAQASRTLASGDYTVRMPEVGRDEVADTARAFNAMAATLERDIADRQRAQQAFQQSEQRLRDLIDGLGPQMFVGLLTLEGVILEVNRPALEVASLSLEDVLGQPVEETYWWSYSEKIQQQLRDAVMRAAQGEASRYDVQIRVAEGGFTVIDLSIQPMRDAHNNVISLVASAIVITERKQAELRIERLAYNDVLTGLANRTALDRQLLKSIQLAEAHNEALALLVMDMVDFRVINDTLGHQNGDFLLVQVAERLKTTLWESDMVARLGGDEFAVLLPRLAQSEHIDIVVKKIEQSLEETFLVGGVTIDVQMAIGIALYPVHGEDAETLMRHADIAMYAAKEKQQTSAIYDPAADHTDSQQLALIVELRQAIQADRLLLHYQPVISVASGQAVGMEALVRWPHPAHGMISPDQFIPMAERTGLINPLTLWVLRTALRQLKDWRRAGHDLYMSVNLSVRDLQQPHIVAQIQQILSDCGIPPQLLTLEITESAVMLDPQRAQKVLSALRAFGIKLSVDDFGIGHASLAYLKTLPVHKLKVDKSFVMDFNDPGNSAIVRTVIELAHRLNLTVTAEGVEDPAALGLLKQFNCDTAQGYFICRPAPVAAIDAWLLQKAGY